MTGECTGGARFFGTNPVENVEWELATGPGADELTLKCSANARYWCSKTGWHDQRVNGEKVVNILKVRCLVSIVINEDNYFQLDTGHAGMRIRCGEYDTIFGYYPKGMSDLEAVSGIEGRSHVVEYSSRDDDQADGVDSYYKDVRRREYFFNASCAACDALRRKWNDLWKDLGKFALYSHNCTTVAAKLVMDEVDLPEKTVMGWKAMGGFASPATLNSHMEAGGLEPVIHEPGQLFHPTDHPDPG